MVKEYTSKYIEGFEIRIYNSDKFLYLGKLYKDGKPTGIVMKGSKGEPVYMETGSKASIIKKLRGFIEKFNSGEAELREVDDIDTDINYPNKFISGDIIIEKNTNIVELSDILVVYKIGEACEPRYTLISFDINDDVVSDTIVERFKKIIDKDYISIGNDENILSYYTKIEGYKKHINELYNYIVDSINIKVKMLNKSNKEFYNDLIAKINKADDMSEFEKAKYIEFVSAAFDNREDS